MKGMGPSGYVSPERTAQLRAAMLETYATNCMFLLAQARRYVLLASGSESMNLLVKMDSLLERFEREVKMDK